MPHIKSIRLVNVHFNNATQFYDDFRMDLGGSNTTYDLENGGGKSLLLLMILQTILPKSFLRKEKPVSLIFQGGKDRTSHSAVEWIQEEGSQYKYLLTGFSARKRKGYGETAGAEVQEDEENLQAGDIEHINWCIFYNDNKITGIKSVPLMTEGATKKTASFEDIRKYIQQMKQKGLPAEVFDRIDKYQSFLSVHNLITAEWNIIKGINSGENSIEFYFRQNSTSRKLIENQFVKIVEDVEALNREEKNNGESFLLADTLIEIRTRLNEYLRLKGHLTEYEKINEYYSEFSRKNDELLDSFREYEGCKQQAVGIWNLLGNKLTALAGDEAEANNRMKLYSSKSIEGKDQKKLLEAGLVNYNKEKLHKTKENLETEKDQLTAMQKELTERLNYFLTLEGYDEYRTVKGKLSEIQMQLLTMEKDAEDLMADYKDAGGKLRFLTDMLFADLESFQRDAEKAKKEQGNESKRKRQELIEEEKKAAVLGNKIGNLSENEKVLGEKQNVLSEFFLKRGEMDAVLAPEEFLRRMETELNGHLTKDESLRETITTLANRIQSLELESVKANGEIKGRMSTKEQHERWLNTYQQELSVLERKATAFGNHSLGEYKEGLELLIHKESINKLEKEIETGRLRQKKQLSEEKGYYVPSEEVLALADQMSGKCEFVQTGIEWIAGSNTEEKETLIREKPYLPYSVIVDKVSFQKIINGRLKLDFSSDYSIPIVNLDMVRSRKNNTDEDIYYFCSFTSLLLNQENYQQYLNNIETALVNMARDIYAADTRIVELNADLSILNVFNSKYSQVEVQGNQQKVQELKVEIAKWQKNRHDMEEEKTHSIKEEESLSKRVEKVSALIAECRDKITKLVESKQTVTELAGVREELSRKKGELEASESEIKSIKDALEKLELEQGLLDDQLNQLKLELHDLQKEKVELAGFSAIENNLTLTQARAEYQALHASVRGRATEESKLISDRGENEERLHSLKMRIQRDYGEDLEEVARSEENGLRIIIPSQVIIEETKSAKEEQDKKLTEAEKELIKIEERIQNAGEKLKEILKDFSEDAVFELPYYESENRYKQEISSVEQLIKSYEEAIQSINGDLKRIGDEANKLTRQAEDYEGFLDREGVANNGTLASELKDYRQFEKEYRRWQDLIQEQCSKWDDRLKTINAETSSFIIREPLDELGRISKPASAAQCLGRKQAFTEYTANIEEQMQKINHDILQLESYQQNFTRRCIQRAEYVLGHLRKLESLSRIEVYARRTNMIELKLPEFEDKEKQLRMKAHIDGIVREISEDEAIDRKRVAAKLATKELLAQIIDMDKAAVRLYKIESIPENSKFYRWENAIGSEGQNNSLYFIFAACLISFIRMLSITTTSVKTKKIIIADNPFGSTSAVYLWDPMFKIMKQNDIQLIAPGHHIPREITSRFGVSYLLNQDILQDGRMRVVVKDVRVEEDEDVLRYVDPEQMSLF